MKTCKSYERAGKELNDGTSSQEANLGQLLRGVEAQAHRFAWGLAGNQEDAKELVQEASTRALRKWQDYDPVRSFQGWYLTIIRNLFLDTRRTTKRALSLDATGPDGDERALIEAISDESLGVLEQLEREEIIAAIHEAMGELSAKYRAVLRLCDLEGMGYEEAARKLGVPVGTVRSRLCRARAALRRDEKIRRLA